MSVGESYGRHRVDRSLDEIAAEMNSDHSHTSNAIPFGQDYEARDYVGAPIRGVSSSSRRHAPYSTSKSSYQDRGQDRRERDRSLERERDGSSAGNRIFVANLSYNTTWQSLKDHMRKAGPVVKCDVFRDAGGNSRGMGLVVYEDLDGAETALRKLANTELDNRKIFLRKDMQHEEREKSGITSYRGRGKPLPNPAATVFVGNLDYGVTWQKLKDIFKVAGRILNVDILTDRDGKSKGLGEVQFEDPNDAIGAIALFHGQMLCDRPMTVRMDSRAPFQPDPLQLKLSSLGANTAIGGMGPTSDLSSHYMGRGTSQRGDYGYDQKGQAPPPHYSGLRDVHHVPTDPYGRSYAVVDAGRHEYHDNRRGGYNSPPLPPPVPSYSRGHDSYSALSGMDSGGYRSSGGGYSGGAYPRRGSDDRRGGGSSWRENDRRSGGTSEGNKRLFIKNLNYSTTWQHLKDTFRGAGSVQHVDIMEGPDGRSKGCAIVWFDTPEAARKAIDMFNDYEVDGRKLEVRYDRMG